MTQRTDYGTAFITGGGSGIGRASALRLAALGARVAVADLRFEAAEEVAQAIRSQGGEAIALAHDVADADVLPGVVAQAEEQLGPIDILVNSAGLILVEPLLDFAPESWNRIMEVNVTGTFRVSQHIARGMAERGYGRIINIASISGLRAGVGRTAYGTSKAAIIGLTRQFALELGSRSITANAIAPGIIETPMTLAAYSEDTWRRVLEMIPARRRGQPEDIAEAVAFLASPAASYVNGEVLTVDGGYVASGMTQTGNLET
ncbi:SDR family oxidoreductase [Rhodovulum sulfidophilum]|uniref:SDR family NAD(P)-dependent oxidoreductase n=1 Tax=Rhodovulum sulfidophilum TaxID=35806 RepID=UPI001922D2F3|nr:SDR family NAD(P)-dependent oxidoreductase [Rhodovulum sulfidophilum]MBL3575845.1 SDR family oxidoreductase [Rhodovulum sulfidophilum]MCE8432755.1 SDR family oxidoreductase [Rhodovulum sulfidophilum]MCF4119116.1 SDR family oxidoreductase [Rhodovulum sulfidophilum]